MVKYICDYTKNAISVTTAHDLTLQNHSIPKNHGSS